MDAVLPVLRGERVLVRPGTDHDVSALHAIRADASVVAWWGAPETAEAIAAALRGETDEVTLVIEIGGQVAGSIQFHEEKEPEYRHASIDIYLAARFQGRGLGAEAVVVLAAHLLGERGHHRLTIDPAMANVRAIRAYERVGFRRVGVMRQYERTSDGTWRDGLLMDLLVDELVRCPTR